MIPRDKVAHIPNACLAPINIMHQFTLNASGDIVDKEHLTLDQSFKWQSGTSVNSRVDKDKLQQCMNGRCLMQLLCWIVAARRKFPNKPIVLQKINVKLAYQRCHLNTATAIKTITQLTKLGCGTGGQPTAVELDLPTHSSTISLAPPKSSSLELLPWLCARQDFQDHLMTDWLTAQSQVPSHMLLLLLFVWPLVGVAFFPHSLGCMAQRVPHFGVVPKSHYAGVPCILLWRHECQHVRRNEYVA